MDIEDIMDKEVRELMQEPTDIDYLIENKECIACIECKKAVFEFPCNKCFRSDSKFSFTEDMRNNIIDRVTEQNQAVL